MSFFLVFAILILLLSLWWFVQYIRFFKHLRMVPGIPWTIPIFGDILTFRNTVDSFWTLHNLTMTRGKGVALRASLGFMFGMNIADPHLLEHIMVHSSAIKKSEIYEFLRNWLGDGLLTSDGVKWHIRRKLLTPAYHFKILEQFIDVFDKNSNIMVEKMRAVNDSQRVDIERFVTLCALDVICETAMGTPVNAQFHSDSEFVIATQKMKHIITERALSLLQHYHFTYQFTSNYRTEKKVVKFLHDYTRSVISARRKELVNKQAMGENGQELESESDVGEKKKVPFLDLLLQTSLSDEEIREEVDTFMLEGHDTVTTAISFSVYNISKYPSIQNRLLEEQRQIFGECPDRETIYSDLQQMKYLEMVIKESLRLYPPVPYYARTVTEDIKYGNDMIIKKDSQLFLGAYCVHRNASIYPDPEKFDPERFTLEECAKRHSFAYVPFSAGFRNCIGQKFAMLEMKSIISKLLRNFEFTDAPNSEIKLRSEIILSTSSGVHVGFQKRVW